MGANRILLKCSCGNYKFVDESEWVEVLDEKTLKYFKGKADKGEFEIRDMECPDCEEERFGG